MPPKPDQPNTKFNAALRDEYIGYLRKGNLKYESARLCGVHYRTVYRHRQDDPEFREAEQHAMAEAREGVEKVLHDLARQGDLGAIRMWMTAHDRSTYGDKTTVTVDATPAALEMSANEALGKVAELQKTLSERHSRLLESGDIIDADFKEVHIPAAIAPAELPDNKFRI